MSWTKNKISPEDINGGKEFSRDDNLLLTELNAMVNSGLYSQDQAEIASALAKNQPDVSDANVVGTPSVTIINAGTTDAKLKFSNLKGDTAISVNVGESSLGDKPNVSNVGTGTDLLLNFTFPKPIYLVDFDLNEIVGGKTYVNELPLLNEQTVLGLNGVLGTYYTEYNFWEEKPYAIVTYANLRGQQGIKGDKGDKGDIGLSNNLTIGSVVGGDEANAIITGDAPNQQLNLVLPKGDKGDKGDIGATFTISGTTLTITTGV